MCVKRNAPHGKRKACGLTWPGSQHYTHSLCRCAAVVIRIHLFAHIKGSLYTGNDSAVFCWKKNASQCMCSRLTWPAERVRFARGHGKWIPFMCSLFVSSSCHC